jgi:hypothetical protein
MEKYNILLTLNTTELAMLKNMLDSYQPNQSLPQQFYHDVLVYRVLRWYVQVMKVFILK